MGLRINTNISALGALRTLDINSRNEARSLERLSTGLRINRGADDPSGLVISEQLRAQLSALNKAVDNSQNAGNLIGVADSALANTSDLLVQIQNSIVFAQNTGGASPAQIAAEQDSVDQAVAAIDRIAGTTRYADRPLLNGNASFQTTTGPTQTAGGLSLFQNLNVKSVNFPLGSFTNTLGVSPLINPQRATLDIQGATGGAATGATIRVTGPRGTQDVVIQTSATNIQIAAAVNTVSGFTGVFASAPGADLVLRSEEFGASQFIKVEGVAGSLNGTASFEQLVDGTVAAPTGTYQAIAPASTSLVAGGAISDRGQDGQVTFNGQLFTGVGRHFNINTPSAVFSFDINPDTITTDAGSSGIVGTLGPAVPTAAGGGSLFTITLGNAGLQFQLRELPLPTDQISLGINTASANKLGADRFRDRINEAIGSFSSQVLRNGFVSSIKTGGGNDLTQNPNNASNIIKAAVSNVASLRGFLGAVQADDIQPNVDSTNVEIQNLSSSLSTIRDLNFAAETTNFTKDQILFQANVAVLASANLVPQSILTLLR